MNPSTLLKTRMLATAWRAGWTKPRPGFSQMLYGRGQVRLAGGRSYGAVDFTPVHLDELPVPKGSWQEHYNMKNRSYNRQLMFGLIYFSVTLYVICRTDIIFFNFSPPSLEEAVEEEDDECACPPPPVEKC